jgi:hypothetical protein
MNQTTSILNQKLSISENALAQEVNREIVILHFVSESYYTLDAVGTKFWHLFTESENVETVIQQLVQICLVDEAALRSDVNSFVEELVEEELLISCDSVITKSHNQQSITKTEELTMPEEAKDKSESQEENQSEKVDNRLPYSPPTLRKHGKINNATNNAPVLGFFDSLDPFIFSDLS